VRDVADLPFCDTDNSPAQEWFRDIG